MYYIIAILIGYLLGSSSMSFYISKIKKINLKENGSKNYGASNTMMLIGKKEAFIVFLHDFFKSFLAYYLTKYMFPELIYIPILAGLATVLGHIFPFYLKFDGGKGFASYVGLIFALNYKIGILTIIMIFIVSFATDYIVAGTFTTIIICPILIALNTNDFLVLIPMYFVSLIILIKHKENIKNLKNKTEPSLRKVLFKK